MIKNGSFENGWYHPNGVAELQIPTDWEFYFCEDVPNPINSDDCNKFVRPEVRILPKVDLPEHEQDLFVLDGDYCLKPFKGFGAWWGGFTQKVDSPGKYRLYLNIYADLVDSYENGQKVPAADPLSGRVRIVTPDYESEWVNLKALEQNGLVFDFTSSTHFTVEFMLPFALENSGIFADKWSLEKLEDVEDGLPRVQYERTYHVLPQNATLEQAKFVLEEVFGKKETIGWSSDDAGIGKLDIRNVVEWGRTPSEKPEYEEFYRTYYPGVSLSFRNFMSPVPPLTPDGVKTTLHLQTSISGWLDYIRDVKPTWVKVFQAELAQLVKDVSPDTKVLWRNHFDNYYHFQDNPKPEEAAKEFLGHFWDSLVKNSQWIDAIEGLNETTETGCWDKNKAAVRFSVALSEELASRQDQLHSHVGLVMLNTAIGNIGHKSVEIEQLIPAVEASIRNGGYIGYHPYFPCYPNPGVSETWMEEEGYHWHLRALESWQPVFSACGLYPRFLFTEGGACGAYIREDGRPGGMENSGAGWGDPGCLNRDWNRYKNLLIRYEEILSYYPNAEAVMLFTSSSSLKDWEYFQLQKEQLESLANEYKV